MTLHERIEWWNRQFDKLVERARNGERNLEFAAAMCVGAITALQDQMKDERNVG